MYSYKLVLKLNKIKSFVHKVLPAPYYEGYRTVTHTNSLFHTNVLPNVGIYDTLPTKDFLVHTLYNPWTRLSSKKLGNKPIVTR